LFNRASMKRLIGLYIVLAFSLTLPAQTTAEGQETEIFRAVADMRVQIARIARDKIYEIYYPRFPLLAPDLADAVRMAEKHAVVMETYAEKHPFLNQAVDVWNNLRFHTMEKLTAKKFVKFYYDTRTLDNLLNISLDRLEEIYPSSDRGRTEFRKQKDFQTGVFRLNTGYMTRKYAVAKSLENLENREIERLEKQTFQYAKNRGYFQSPGKAEMLAALLNDWNFLKYNLHNALFPADRIVFSVSNSLRKRTERLIRANLNARP